jgi:hypothetical protein
MKIILNSFLTILTAITILFTTFFWIGSKERYDEMIKNEFYIFFIGKFAFNLIIILFYISLAYVLNKRVFKLQTSKKIFINSLIVFNLISLLFITLFFFH